MLDFYERRSGLSSINHKIIFSATMKWGPPQSKELSQQLVAYWKLMKVMKKTKEATRDLAQGVQSFLTPIWATFFPRDCWSAQIMSFGFLANFQ